VTDYRGRDAEAWGSSGVLDFFGHNRRSSADVYPSERFFLDGKLREGMSVLDVGCAQGGFADILSEHLQSFSYTGVDVNAAMIERARARHPKHDFFCVTEADYSALGEAKFDLVLVLGILHLHDSWRDTLRGAWARTRNSLIFDLRHTGGPTVEDRDRSYLAMDFGGSSRDDARVPYILVNAGEAQKLVEDTCADARAIAQYGYRHAVSPSASTPLDHVIAATWCVDR